MEPTIASTSSVRDLFKVTFALKEVEFNYFLKAFQSLIKADRCVIEDSAIIAGNRGAASFLTLLS